MKKVFNVRLFDNLPASLKPSDYIDMLLFLLGYKRCVRLGYNSQKTYNEMVKWCNKSGYAYVISSEGFMYISKNKILSVIAQNVDDSKYKHSYFLGRLFGYPKCCCKQISLISENEIDDYEYHFCKTHSFEKPYDIINPDGYIYGNAYISHIPCCSKCKKSLKIASEAKATIEKYQTHSNMKTWIQ